MRTVVRVGQRIIFQKRCLLLDLAPWMHSFKRMLGGPYPGNLIPELTLRTTTMKENLNSDIGIH